MAPVIDVDRIEQIDRDEARELAEVEYGRFAEAVAALAPEDWVRPTDCELWDVRDLVRHMLGAMRSAASVRELVSQQREIARRVRQVGGNTTDAMTAVQVERTFRLEDVEIVAEIQDLVEPAATGRWRIPRALRRLVTFPVEVGDEIERWTLGYLVDVIQTRDTWLHRIDLARAVGREPEQDGRHDARIVADIVAEWSRRHRRPFQLTLTGAAGGEYRQGTAGEAITLDAVEFCRVLSGRAGGEGLLSTPVPF